MNDPRDLDEHGEEIPHVLTFSIYQGRALNRLEELDVPTRNRYPPIGDIEDKLNEALICSSEPSYGGGIRRFNVESFLSRLASSEELYPGILVSEAVIEPFGLPLGSYQVLSEITLFLDTGYCFILPPYYEADPQGNYDLSRDIYLM